ncbi:ribosome-binding protein 1 [Cricetulus griseus]|nr:ribosome-binding protein 1 [Cricetulus griseus]
MQPGIDSGYLCMLSSLPLSQIPSSGNIKGQRNGEISVIQTLCCLTESCLNVLMNFASDRQQNLSDGLQEYNTEEPGSAFPLLQHAKRFLHLDTCVFLFGFIHVESNPAKMDIYDTQTLGVVVFGGFMVVSAIGIFLVSTFSMKETSYEEALANQRKEMAKTHHQKGEKKKKEKTVEKKGKTKKKEEKPNGKIPDHDLDSNVTIILKEPVRVPAMAVAPTSVHSSMVHTPVATVPAMPQEKLASSPKDKKKKEKKVAKVEPAVSSIVNSIQVLASKSAILEATPKEVPMVAVPPVGSKASAPATSSQGKKGEGAQNQAKKGEGAQNQAKKGEGAQNQAKKGEGAQNQAKKGGEGAQNQGKKGETNQNQAKKGMVQSQEAPKQEAPAKKKSGSKRKAEPGSPDCDSPLFLPYKTLVSTVGSMMFNEGEAQRLIEILSEKIGVTQDTWHKATQKGDPVAILKRQLEEKEKLLATEQEDAAVAKSKLRELNKEMASEKAKAAAGEAKVKKQLVAREQEIAAVQARMQASYQDHVKEVQQLQGKIRTLQEQLENGPNTQLARLQQENSILRDALNQATSQVESKQNTELAKLRQELSKVNKELVEKSEASRQEEQQRKALEAKAATFEKQVLQLQASHKESEEALQKRLEEVTRELCRAQSSHASLRADAEKAQEQQQRMAELHSKLQSSEVEVKSKCEELSNLHGQLKEARAENEQLTERIHSIETLLEAGQAQNTQASQAEADQQQIRLKELESQVLSLEKETSELKEAMEQQKGKNNDLREKNWKAMEALALAERTCEEKLHSLTQAKEESEKQLHLAEAQTKEVLLALLPDLSISAHQNYAEWLREVKEKGSELLKKPPASLEPSLDVVSKLREAEETQNSLQAECDQYRSILAETEGMLKDLQKSVEEEERVWKAKVGAAEEELQKSRVTVKHLEDIVEKLKGELESSDQVREHTSFLEAELEKHMAAASAECQNYAKEVAGLRQLLLDSQSQLDEAKSEAQKQSTELALVRQQLSDMKSHVEDGDVAGSPAVPPAEQDPIKLKTQLERTEAILEDEQTRRQKLTAEFEEAQSTACRLQEELEKLRAAGGPLESSGIEEVTQLKERLEKEKRLTSDLGRAATKLQELLKTTQEQLTKEKDTVKKLQEQLEKAEDGSSSKEGTSV